jgi:hypothetical protein
VTIASPSPNKLESSSDSPVEQDAVDFQLKPEQIAVCDDKQMEGGEEEKVEYSSFGKTTKMTKPELRKFLEDKESTLW